MVVSFYFRNIRITTKPNLLNQWFYPQTICYMKLQVQSIHFDADQKLLEYVQKRLDKLDTFYDRITDGEVFLKLDKADARENKVVEVKLLVPNTNLFAKAHSASFEAATDEVAESLKIQLKKHKEKMMGL